MPLDFQTNGLLIDDDIRHLLADRIPDGARLTAVFDNCFSGTCLDLRYNYLCERRRHHKRWLTTHTITEDTNHAVTAGDVAFLSGCSDSQTSTDAAENGRPGGAFTNALFDVLAERGYVNVPYADLVDAVRQRLKTEDFEQIPQLSFGRRVDLHAVWQP